MAGSQIQSHLVMPICTVNDAQQNNAITTTAIGDQYWTVQYSRFFNYPSPPPTAVPHPSITISKVNHRWKGTWLSTSSSDASLSLTVDHSRSSDDSVLSVTFRHKILEEHYISKLQFTWPQMSCLTGYPPRGSRVIFVSYKDHLGQIQKFALRFLTFYESVRFAKFVKQSLEDDTATGVSCGNPRSELSSQSEFIPDELAYRPRQAWSPTTISGSSVQKMAPSLNHEEHLEDDTSTVLPKSELSSQTEFIPPDEVAYRPTQDWNPMTFSGTYVQKMASSSNHEVSQNSISQKIASSQDDTSTVLPCGNPKSELLSQTEVIPSSDELAYRPRQDWSHMTFSGTSVQKMDSSLNHEVSQNTISQNIAYSQDVGAKVSAFPPSFTSLLMNCCPIPKQGPAKPTASPEVADLKTEITKYLENPSFQDMLSKVQRVINEIGDDLLL